MDLVCIVGRDRGDLVETALTGIAEARRQHDPGHDALRVAFYLDPLTVEYGAEWLTQRGVDLVARPDLPDDLAPRPRVARMRCQAVETAAFFGARRLINLDSDVLIDPEFFARLDDMWAWAERAGVRFGAATMGNYAGYDDPGFGLEPLPGGRSIRSHALGGCLALPITERLRDVARRGVPAGDSWDSHFCTEAAGRRVLTSGTSYVRHLGVGERAGMCKGVGFPDLDWSHLSPALRDAR